MEAYKQKIAKKVEDEISVMLSEAAITKYYAMVEFH